MAIRIIETKGLELGMVQEELKQKVEEKHKFIAMVCDHKG